MMAKYSSRVRGSSTMPKPVWLAELPRLQAPTNDHVCAHRTDPGHAATCEWQKGKCVQGLSAVNNEYISQSGCRRTRNIAHFDSTFCPCPHLCRMCSNNELPIGSLPEIAHNLADPVLLAAKNRLTSKRPTVANHVGSQQKRVDCPPGRRRALAAFRTISWTSE